MADLVPVEGRPFIRLVLPSPVQARRIWDRLRWQTDRFHSMFEFCERRGAAALVLTMAHVLGAGRRIMLVHGPRDPKRPLRHWRPPEGARDADGGSDEPIG